MSGEQKDKCAVTSNPLFSPTKAAREWAQRRGRADDAMLIEAWTTGWNARCIPEEPGALADHLSSMLLDGTVQCPLCGRTGPHPHSPEEIVIYRNGVKYGRSLKVTPDETTEPIPMILHCPQCRTIHVDEPNPERGWTNPPHRSHECQNCECIWRPADVPTTGVLHISTKGRADTVDNRSLASKENCEHGFKKGRCTFCVPSSPLEPTADGYGCTGCRSTPCICDQLAEKASALPFERACDRCGKVIKMRQPVTSTVYYCSIECAD